MERCADVEPCGDAAGDGQSCGPLGARASETPIVGPTHRPELVGQPVSEHLVGGHRVDDALTRPLEGVGVDIPRIPVLRVVVEQLQDIGAGSRRQRVATAGDQKLKKTTGGPPRLELVENPDILRTISKLPRAGRPRLVIGFAAETEKVVQQFLTRPEEYDADTCGPGPFSMASEETDRAMLEAAGFTDVEVFRQADPDSGKAFGVSPETIDTLAAIITLFGIATRNGIMLVSHYEHLRASPDVSVSEAIERGSADRLIPILMTALSSGLALVPLVLAGHQPGNEIQAPMGVVILGGLLSSTLLNMFVVPTIYAKVAGGKTSERALT